MIQTLAEKRTKCCRDCKNYDREEKKCKLTGEFTRRKGLCDNHEGGK
jgi:hypothetical protein